MHILLIHQAFAAVGEPGGTRHHEFARGLAGMGHWVTIVAGQVSYLTGEHTGRGGWPQEQTDVPGVRILRCYTYRGWHRSFLHRVLSFFSFMASSFVVSLRVRSVDVVWGTSPPLFQGFTAWLLARLKGAGFLFEVRDLWPEFAIAAGVLRNPILIRLSTWLEGFLYSRADRLVVNSPGFIEPVRQRGGREIELVANGVDVRMFDPSSRGEDFRTEHGLQTKYVALYAGAHGLSNDLTVVLEAARRLTDRPDIALVFLGDGKEKPRLMRQAESLELRNVQFLPSMPKEQMAQALAAADACIAILLPLEAYKTTYPNKVFDYMAAGRPVALAIDGVIRQVVEGAGAGIFVPPGDGAALAAALRRLADDPAGGRRMGAAGRRCVEASFDRQRLSLEMARALLAAAQARGRDGGAPGTPSASPRAHEEQPHHQGPTS